MSEPTNNELSPAGQERRTRMLLELQGALKRRAARRRAMRRGGSAAAFFLAVGAIGVAAWMQRSGPLGDEGPSVAIEAPAPARAETTGSRLMNVDLVAPPTRRPAAAVLGTDATRIAKYVAAPTSRSKVEVVSDEGLMRALAGTGNDYGLIRVGDDVRVKCNSCDGGAAPWERNVPEPGDPPGDDQ